MKLNYKYFAIFFFFSLRFMKGRDFKEFLFYGTFRPEMFEEIRSSQVLISKRFLITRRIIISPPAGGLVCS